MAYAQTEYTLSHSNSTYNELTAATDISSDVWDIQLKQVVLPFGFKYFGLKYDTVYISPQQVSFNKTLNTYDNIFLGSHNFLAEQGNANLSPVSYKTEGMSPNRIFKIQFKNVNAELQDEEEQYSVNNQMWFYETTNVFEFRFGPNVITDLNFTEFVMGFIDYDNSPYLAISGTAANPTLVRVMNAGTFTGIPTQPLTGQVYKFTPGTSTQINAIEKPYNFKYFNNKFQLNSDKDAQIKITDINGKVLKTIDHLSTNNTFYSLEDLASGVYIVSISDSTGTYSEKILKY